MRRLYLLMFIFLAFVINGCGGGGGTSTNKKAESTTIKGRVVDGEIKGATIFLDVNKNGLLDKGEASTKSDESGYFTLEVAKKYADDLTIPIVAQGGFDIRANSNYQETLMALREKNSSSVIVTPISTLIASDVLDTLKNQKNLRVISITSSELYNLVQEAKKNFAEVLQLDLKIITKDPIELSLNSNKLDLLQTNMKVNKVAREIKKAIKKEIRAKKRASLRSFRALSRALKEVKKQAKAGDEALVSAANIIEKYDLEAFNLELISFVKQSTKYVLSTFKQKWKANKAEIIKALKDKKESFKDLNKDTTKPIITINGDNPLTLKLGAKYSELGATAIDDKDGLIKVQINNSNVNTKKAGEYKVKYTAVDSAGNKAEATRVVKVIKPKDIVKKDTTPPTIKLNGANPQTLEFGSKYQELGASVSDNVDNTPSLEIDSSKVDVNKLGEYKVKYVAVDKSGNKAEATRVVKVVDTTAPKITLKGNSSIIVELGGVFVDAGFSANDNVDGDITSKVKVNNSVNTKKVGEYKIVYSVSDSSGNKAEATRVVKVVDRVAPQAPTILPVSELTNKNSIEVTIKGEPNSKVLVDSKEIGKLNSKGELKTALDLTKEGKNSFKVQLKDSANNISAITILTITKDTTAPTISLKGDNPLTITLGSSYKELGADVKDNIDKNPSLDIDNSKVDTANVGEYSVKYTAVDSAGNKAEATRVVKVTKPKEAAKSKDVKALIGDWNGSANHVHINLTLNADGTYKYHSRLGIGKYHNYYRYSDYEGKWSLQNGNSQVVLELPNVEAPLVITNNYPTLKTPAGVELSSNDIDKNYKMQIDQSQNKIEAKYTQKAKEYMARDIADYKVDYFTMVAAKANSEAFWSSANVKPAGYNFGPKLGLWSDEWKYALKRIKQDPKNYTIVISDEYWQTMLGNRHKYMEVIQDPEKVYRWFEYFKDQMQILGKVEGTVLYIFGGDAPPFWASDIRSKYNNDPKTAAGKIIESRFPEVLERNPSNSFAGIFQMMDYLRMKYAPNVKLGYTLKTWGIAEKDIYHEPSEGWDNAQSVQVMADYINNYEVQFDFLAFNFHPRSSHTVAEYESGAKYFGAISKKLITRDGSEPKLWIWKISLWNKEQPKFDFTHINYLVNECNTIGMTLGHGNDLTKQDGFKDDSKNGIYIKSWIDEYYNHKTIDSIPVHANQDPIYWR